SQPAPAFAAIFAIRPPGFAAVSPSPSTVALMALEFGAELFFEVPTVKISPFQGELLLFARQREVTKRKHAPTSGSDRPWAIRLPSLRCRSGGRQRRTLHGPTPPCAAVLAAYPLRNTSARPSVGDPEVRVACQSCLGWRDASLLLRFCRSD